MPVGIFLLLSSWFIFPSVYYLLNCYFIIVIPTKSNHLKINIKQIKEINCMEELRIFYYRVVLLKKINKQ